MHKDLLLIIDMQNVYSKGGEWCCPSFETALDNIEKLILKRPDNLDIAFTKFIASENPEGVWNDYNREYRAINDDEYACSIHPRLIKYLDDYPVFTKSHYSSLDNPEIKEMIKKYDRIIVCGVVAECCVLFTATALIDEGVKVYYLTDAVAGISHELEEMTVKVLEGLSPLHICFMTTDAYLQEQGREKK